MKRGKLLIKANAGERWVTIKQGHLKGRHILIDGKGYIVGGAVPRAFHGHHIAKLKGIGAGENPYHEYEHHELKEIHRDFKEAHEDSKKELKNLIHDTARQLRDMRDDWHNDDWHILNRVKEHGGIRAPKPGGRFHTEYHESIPHGIKRLVGRQNGGLPLDEMADELGMSAGDLIQELANAEAKGSHSIGDFYDDAIKAIGHDQIRTHKESIEEMARHLDMLEAAMRMKEHEKGSKKPQKLAASFIDKFGRLLVKKSNGDEEDHYYPSDRFAYKVHHSKDPIYIPINRIRMPYQTDDSINEDKVRENIQKMKSGENLQPLVIGYHYDLHDGHHRLEAAKRLGHTHVPCVVGGRNERRKAAAEKRYRKIWKSTQSEKTLVKKLSPHLSEKVANGEAHWVTVKEGPLEGRHLLIEGSRPAAGEKSKGTILAGHGIPPHVIEKITGAKRAEEIDHHRTSKDHAMEHLERLDKFRNYPDSAKERIIDRVEDYFKRGFKRVVVAVKSKGANFTAYNENQDDISDQKAVDDFRGFRGWSRGAQFVVIHNPEHNGAPAAHEAFVHGTDEVKYKKDYDKRQKLGQRLKNVLSSFGVRDVEFNKANESDEKREQIANIAQKSFDVLAKLVPTKALKKTGVKIVLGKFDSNIKAWAYYRPANRSIFISSDKGMQPFYHEYGHAMDHALGNYEGYSSETGHLRELIGEIKNTGTYNDFIKTRSNTGKFNRRYYSSGREVFARFFAVYVQRKAAEKSVSIPNDLAEGERFERYTDSEMNHLSNTFERIMKQNGLSKAFIENLGHLLVKKWVTIHPHGGGAVGKYGDKDYRRIEIDDNGVIIGGSVPKQMRGQNISDKKAWDSIKNPQNEGLKPNHDAPEDPHKRLSYFARKIKEGRYNAADVKDQYNWLQQNKERVISSVRSFLDTSDKFKRKRKATKDEIAGKAYEHAVERLAYAADDAFSWQPFSETMEQAVKRHVDKLTDDAINDHVGKQKAEQEKQSKILKNPETLDELRQKKYMTGRLTDDEQAKLDELESLHRKEQKQQEQATRTVNGLENKNIDFDVSKTKHTKTGKDIWVVKPKERVGKDEYNNLNSKMKAIGGYYSRFTHGFNFDSDPTEHLAGLKSSGATVENPKASEEYQENHKKAIADRLRTVADNMQSSIDNKRSDRLTNTARRAAMAASAEADADRMERSQRIMRNIADAIESGEAKHLDELSTRTQVETLERILNSSKWDNDQRNGVHYEDSRRREPSIEDVKNIEYPKPYANIDALKSVLSELKGRPGTKRAGDYLSKLMDEAKSKGKYSIEFDHGSRAFEEVSKLASMGKVDPGAKYYAERVNDGLMTSKRLQAMGIETSEQLRAAMREYVQHRNGTGVSAEDRRHRELRDLEGKVTRMNIPGFFPTPKSIVNRMVEEADIKPGMKVLEPSAGKGNIADAIKDAQPEADLDTVEYSNSLREILNQKGHKVVGHDFLQHEGEYDRIVMNPPFENGQDIDHVKRAYDMLKPGGKVVAIMSEGPFSNSTGKSKAFREWMDNRGGYSEKLPEGSFKNSERSTGVNTRMVIIEKPKEARKSMSKSGPKTTKMYHGSWQRIDKFENRKIKDYNTIGSWFTSDPQTAIDLYGPILHTADVELKNPYEAETDNLDRFFFDEKLAKRFLNGKDFNNPDRDVMTKLLNSKKYMTAFKKKLVRQGYDGIVFRNSMIDKDPGEKKHTVYIVFYPGEQVKHHEIADSRAKKNFIMQDENHLSKKDLTSKDRDKMKRSLFALPSKKMFPMPDEGHVRLAFDMLNRADISDEERKEARKNILLQARRLGMDTSNWSRTEKSIFIQDGKLLIKKSNEPKVKYSKESKGLSQHLRSRVLSGDAHWVTVKEGPLEGRHLLISGPRPVEGEKSKGHILAGRGIPPHVIEAITGATHGHHLEHEQTAHDSKGEPIPGKKPKRQKKNPFNVEPPGGWKESDKVGSKVKPEEPKIEHNFKHPVGTKIYYRGDMANPEGWFKIVGTDSSKYGHNYKLQEIGGDGRTKNIPEIAISDVDKGNGSTRFVTEDAHNKFKQAAQESIRRHLEEARKRKREREQVGNEDEDNSSAKQRQIEDEQQQKQDVNLKVGSTVDLGNGVQGIISHNDKHGYVIREPRTDRFIHLGSSIQDAVKNAREEVKRKGPEFKADIESELKGPFKQKDVDDYNHTTQFDTTVKKLNERYHGAVASEKKEALQKLKQYGVDEIPGNVQQALDKLAEAHEHVMREEIRARIVAPPWSVTGRANYRGKPDRADAIRRNSFEKLEQAKKRVDKAIEQFSPKKTISSDEFDAVGQLKQRIDEAEKRQESMKQANKYIKQSKDSDRDKVKHIMSLGFDMREAAEAVRDQKFPSFMLTNNNANIKRMKDRVKQLETNRSQSSTSHSFDGGIIHDNVDDNRVQIFFNEKPSAELRTKMKSKGFRWAPSATGPNGEEGAWQRMRSGSHVLDIAKGIVGSSEVKKSANLFVIMGRLLIKRG